MLNKFIRTRSLIDTDVLLVGLTLGIATIVLFMNKSYILGIVFLLFLMYIIYKYFNIPDCIFINDTGIQFGKIFFQWNEIEQVLFTVNEKNYKDTQIMIYMGSSKYRIHTSYYANHIELRNLIETLCKEKGIKYVVRDRGLY